MVLRLKITPRCAACILYARTRELEKVLEDVNEQIAYFSSLLEAVQLYFVPEAELTGLAVMSFKRLLSMVGSNPYDKEKAKVFSLALERAEAVRDLVEGARDVNARFRLALSASAMASRLEAHMFKYEPPSHVEVLAAKLSKDDTSKLLEMLSKGGYTIYYLPASIGELPYDYIVLDLLKENFDVRIVALVRQEPYMDYVTIDDVGEVDLEDHVDEVISYPSATLAKDEASELYERFAEPKSIVLVKGLLQSLYMANNPPAGLVFAVFQAYCDVAVKVFNTGLNSLNALILHEPQEYHTRS